MTPAAQDPEVADGGGSGAADAPTEAVSAPPVMVGNGRAPGELTDPARGAPSQRLPGPVDAAVAAGFPAVSPQLPLPDQLRGSWQWQRTVASVWAAAAAPSRPGGLLFGLAGLLLAPIAGAWLGYRQARASRAAAELTRR
jgi:hypothetical protein